MNCYPTNYHPYDYIIHYMGVKSKININKRISIWNDYIKHEKEEVKIYVSMTTIPERLTNLPLVIEKLLQNTIKPNKIVINVPKKYLLFESDNHIEHINKCLEFYINKGEVIINIVENDYGPITKYTGICNYVEKNNLLQTENFGVVILDDELLYDNNIISEYKNQHLITPRSILTFYHMSGTKCACDIGTPLLLKGADTIFLPKYFFVQNMNPSLEEVVINGIKDYKHCGFLDDNLFTAFSCYKHMDKISISDKTIRKGRTCYSYTPIKEGEYGVSKNNKGKFIQSHTDNVVNNMEKYYDYNKYSNVKFIYNK